MAVLKKNQVNQILFTMVDKTDFTTLETSLASNFTIKRVGVNHGSAAANISTLSRAPSKVGSGLYRLSLEANATNYDYVALRIAHASALTQMLVYEMRTYDDTDNYSLLSDFQSDFASRVPKEIASKSLLSDVNSDLASKIGGITVSMGASDISDIVSGILAGGVATQSKLGAVETSLLDTRSKLVVMSGIQSDLYSLLSDLNSNIMSRVPKEVATASGLTVVYNSLLSEVNGLSDIQSKVYALISDLDSNFQSRVPKEIASKSLLSDVNSNLLSYLGGISNILSAVYVDTADISNVLSNVHADLADLSGVVSDFYSDFGSRVPKEIASKSLLSDVNSDLASKIGAITVTIGASDVSDIASAVVAGMTTLTPSDISDIASAVWAYTTRKITSMADVSLCASDLSDIRSAITAGGGTLTASNISDIASAVWGYATKEVSLGASDLSDIRSVVLSLSGMLSDAHSAAAQANSRALVMGSTLSDIDSALSSQFTKGQSDLSDLYSLLSDLNSNIMSRVPKEVASKSLLSDVNSNLLSYLAGISDVISNIHGDVADISNVISNTHADLENLSGVASNIYSLLSDLDSNIMSRVPKEVANASQLLLIKSNLSDIESAIDSQAALNASGLSDILSGVTRTRKILQNRMKITSATGAAKIYDDDDATVLLSDTITADATSTVRTRFA